jgi:hypothetical protein
MITMIATPRQAPMLGYLLALISVAALTGCPKDDAKVDPATQSSASPSASRDVPTFQINGTPQTASATPSSAPSAAPLASATPTPSATTTTTATAPSATGKATASATTTAAASVAPPPSATTPPAPTAKTVASHVSGKNFGVDASSAGCKAGDSCVVTIRLNVTGSEYHVNKEYPYKFIASANPAVQYLGSGDANTFSRASGDFREDGEKSATMTVRFKAKSAGDANVSGTFKLSVCSADNCQLDQANVNLTVPVL